MITYNFKFLFYLPVNVYVMSSYSLHGQQPSTVERDFGKYGRVTKIQIRVGAQGHLTRADPSSAPSSYTLLRCPGVICITNIHTRTAILLEKFSSDQLAKCF